MIEIQVDEQHKQLLKQVRIDEYITGYVVSYNDKMVAAFTTMDAVISYDNDEKCLQLKVYKGSDIWVVWLR
jgi:hypothetical protein